MFITPMYSPSIISYEVNGTLVELLDDVKYLLSPQDLMAIDFVPELVVAGTYNTTQHYTTQRSTTQHNTICTNVK